MKNTALASLLLLLALAFVVVAQRPPAKTHEVSLNGHTFTLPAGFEIELVAGPPLVNRPIVADFDDQGRLYVADSSGSSEPVKVQLEKKPHRIVRLESSRGDGHFDRGGVFADGMMFPEGVMWLAGSLYVAAPPSIWKLTETTGEPPGSTRRLQREEWFQGKTLTGCANDLHGPYAGPDGWIYWCKGAFARQTYERPGKPPFVTRASHIFRCRPDGTGIEPVMSGGMDNPVDVVFTPGGERIFTTTFFQHPGGGKRDGLIHAVYGGAYGKDHDVIHEHPWTGPALMPVLTHLGAAAPCGLTRYEGTAFGAEYQDNLFACLFNMQKVTRHVLEPSGATFTTRDEDFLVSSNHDFHPTDVLEDADGSLLVIDTGGWYKLCCPTSQLYKPDVLGAIYRIRRTGAPRVEDPRGLKLAWAKMSVGELAALLDDSRPAVRRRVVQTLGAKGKEAVGVLHKVVTSDRPAEAKRNAVWAATRIDGNEARVVARTALSDQDETVRQVALHSISLWRDREAVPELRLLLGKQKSLQNQRAAAEGLGRIGDRSVVPDLLARLGSVSDRFLEHSLIYALIEIADSKATAAGLQSHQVRVRRAALIALDQMEGGGLQAETTAREMTAADPEMRETALWIVGRHPEWGPALAGLLRDRLGQKALAASEQEALPPLLARFARTPAVQELLAERLRDATATRPARRCVLRAMALAGLKETPPAWLAGLTQVLKGDDGELVADAVTTVRSLTLPKQGTDPLTAALLHLAGAAKSPVQVRLGAAAAVPGGLLKVEPALFTFLTAHLGADEPVTVRSLAADVLSRARLTTEQLLALCDSLKTAGPMEVNRLLEAFVQSADDTVGLKLLAALDDAAVRPGLRADQLRPRLAKYGPKVKERAEKLYAALDVDAAKQKARLEELLATLKDGDVRRGQAVFNSTKAACSSCHAIGYLGGRVGPDLTKIGAIRTERDLLESIVFPSASFVRSFEPVLVTTRKGKAVNGLVKKDTPEEMVLTTGATEEVRIAREEIEDVQPGKVSIMPAGLDQQLTPRDLADLVAFLKACR
jgi:putative membrane-bound dehydrogenase-like protein